MRPNLSPWLDDSIYLPLKLCKIIVKVFRYHHYPLVSIRNQAHFRIGNDQRSSNEPRPTVVSNGNQLINKQATAKSIDQRECGNNEWKSVNVQVHTHCLTRQLTNERKKTACPCNRVALKTKSPTRILSCFHCRKARNIFGGLELPNILSWL